MPLVEVKVHQRGDQRPRYVYFGPIEPETALTLQQLVIELGVAGRIDRGCVGVKFDQEFVVCVPANRNLQSTLRVLERACVKKLGLHWGRVDPEDREYEDMRRAALMIKPYLERLGLNSEDYL